MVYRGGENLAWCHIEQARWFNVPAQTSLICFHYRLYTWMLAFRLTSSNSILKVTFGGGMFDDIGGWGRGFTGKNCSHFVRKVEVPWFPKTYSGTSNFAEFGINIPIPRSSFSTCLFVKFIPEYSKEFLPKFQEKFDSRHPKILEFFSILELLE